MNMQRILRIVGGVIAIVIAFVIYPMVLTATQSILTYAHIASFTGMSSVAAIAPLIIFVSMIFGGGLMVFQGAKGSGKDLGMKNIIMIVGGLIDIVIMLLLFPTILASAYTIITDAHIADYTGLASVGAIAPLVLFVSSLFGGGLLSWTGLGKPGKGGF